MPITVNSQTNITMLPPGFVSIANDLLKDTSLDASEIVALVFRAPDHGDLHPVEIHFDSKGDVLSITSPEFEFSFEHDRFRQVDSARQNLECGRGILGLKLANLAAHYKSGAYEVEVIRL